MLRRAGLLVFLAGLGCHEVSDKSASSERSASIQQATAPLEASETLRSAPFQKSAVTLVAQGGRIHASTFERFEGVLTLTGNTPDKLDLTLELASLVGSDKKALETLRGPEALDVPKNPKAFFRSSRIVPGAGADVFEITGDLELSGHKYTVTLPVRLHANPDAFELQLRQAIAASEWSKGTVSGKTEPFTQGVELIVRLIFPRTASPLP